MKASMPFMREEGGFTTPAAALAILVICALLFVCLHGAVIESRSGQIQYVADAGALAADNLVAEFVTVGQVVDAALLSLSLLAVTVYIVSAIAAFIPGGQSVAAELAAAGAKIFRARDSFADSAVKGLNAAQKALPALCAVRSSQVVKANAQASGIPYAGIAIASPMQGEDITLPDDAEAEAATKDIESMEEDIQKESLKQKEAQEKEDAAKWRAWYADCGKDGMNMCERAATLSCISPAQNPSYSIPDNWNFSVPLNRAISYYQARYDAEPGAWAGGSPESIGESVARKRFYAYAHDAVSQGYIETSESGAEVPHLIQLARNTDQIRSTFLYTESIYPVSKHEDTLILHAYGGCPKNCEGEDAGYSSVSSIDGGGIQKCPDCNFSATTLGRVPSASTSIDNGFEYYYLAVVEASREYADAIHEGDAAKRALEEARQRVGDLIKNALSSLAGKRYDPQPPGRYGCVCIVLAPDTRLRSSSFLNAAGTIPARIAISGATLAPDEASEEGTVITGVAEGLFPSNSFGSGVFKLIFRGWSSMLTFYSKGNDELKQGLRKTLGAIPLVGTTISDEAISAFENALSTAGFQPADLKTYKPVLVNTSHIIARDKGVLSKTLGGLKQGTSIYSASVSGDIDALVSEIESVPAISNMLDEKGLKIARIPLSELGMGNQDGTLYFPVPKDIAARLEEARSLMASLTSG